MGFLDTSKIRGLSVPVIASGYFICFGMLLCPNWRWLVAMVVNCCAKLNTKHFANIAEKIVEIN